MKQSKQQQIDYLTEKNNFLRQLNLNLEKDIAIKDAEIKGLTRSGNIEKILESSAHMVNSVAHFMDFVRTKNNI